jgi:hypothetical protein
MRSLALSFFFFNSRAVCCSPWRQIGAPHERFHLGVQPAVLVFQILDPQSLSICHFQSYLSLRKILLAQVPFRCFLAVFGRFAHGLLASAAATPAEQCPLFFLKTGLLESTLVR